MLTTISALCCSMQILAAWPSWSSPMSSETSSQERPSGGSRLMTSSIGKRTSLVSAFPYGANEPV
jgi:hypothetical protein